MKLTVENFGPIRKARVDVRQMTVFAGHSNTGKSYLAMLIYATVKAFSISARFSPACQTEVPLTEGNIFEVKKHPTISRTDLHNIIEDIIDVVREQWQTEAMRCFGGEWENLIRQNGKPASIVVSDAGKKVILNFLSPGNDKLPPIEYMHTKVNKRISSSFLADRKEINVVDRVKNKILIDLGELIYSEVMELFGCQPISQSDSSGIRYANEGSKAHYLPAARGGLMQNHRNLVSSVVDRAPTIGLAGAEFITFTGVSADFLQKILNAGERMRCKGKEESISALAEKIEKNVMRGDIQMKMLATRYPDFRYKFVDKNASPRDILLMNASSSVAELAPIVLFIRYYLAPGDIFIVEEPEANLHPGAQRIVAGVLVELVKAGVYVIATTHSDIILEQISNFVYADKISGAKILGEKAGECTLSEHEIAVYSFPARGAGKGTNVRKIRFSEETGALTKDHLDVSSRLYNETVNLLNAKNAADEATSLRNTKGDVDD